MQEPQPINPLGQHLPFPMNVNAPQEASPPHEYLRFEIPSPDLGRRRATLPTILANPETQSLDGRRKLLPTWEEQRDGESIPSPQIGIALSSPPHAGQFEHSLQSKRRSRSAGALRDLAKARPSVERRRSAEIRHWRSSYASASVYSTNTPRPQTARTVETVQTADTRDTHDTMAKPPESIASPSTFDDAPTVAQHDQDISQIPIEAFNFSNSDPRPVAQHDQDISQIQLPVEAFNFGNLRSGFSDDEDSEEPALPPRSENRLSIEDRVRHLEDNMRTLETSVRRISGRSNRQTIILENAPKGRRSRNRSSSATSDRQSLHHSSSKSSNHTLHGHHEADAPSSPTLAPLSAVKEFPSSTDRPETIISLENRPSTAQRSDLVSQFNAIQEALKHERTARKTLESQVSTLQRELSDLHALVTKIMCATSPSYPTPSPDAIIASNEERMSTPRASTTQRGPKEMSLFPSPFSRRSETDSEGRGRGDWSVSSSREDVTSPEDWATPKEESGFGSGFFGPQRTRSRDALKQEDEIF